MVPAESVGGQRLILLSPRHLNANRWKQTGTGRGVENLTFVILGGTSSKTARRVSDFPAYTELDAFSQGLDFHGPHGVTDCG